MMRDKPGPQEVRHRRAFDMNGLCLLGGLNGVNVYIRVVYVYLMMEIHSSVVSISLR